MIVCWVNKMVNPDMKDNMDLMVVPCPILTVLVANTNKHVDLTVFRDVIECYRAIDDVSAT